MGRAPFYALWGGAKGSRPPRPIGPLEIVDWAGLWWGDGARFAILTEGVPAGGPVPLWPDESQTTPRQLRNQANYGVPGLALSPAPGVAFSPAPGVPAALGDATSAPIPRPWGLAVVIGTGAAPWGFDTLGGDTLARTGAVALRVTNTGQVNFVVTRTNGTAITTSPAGTMSTGWHLILCDIDAAGLARVFFDGEQASQAITNAGNLDTDITAVMLGGSRDPGRANNGFRGPIALAGTIGRTFTDREVAGLAAWALERYGELAPPVVPAQDPALDESDQPLAPRGPP